MAGGRVRGESPAELCPGAQPGLSGRNSRR
jgi:hypothetical protein